MWTQIRDWIEHLFKPRYRPERHYMRGRQSR
jgi:hypothetical protein